MHRARDWTRREWLRLAAAATACGIAPRLHAAPAFAADPFSLGIASGYPLPGGVVLWTRLAPEPLAPGGGMPPLVVPVRWEVADDEAFARLAASGTAWATPELAHSVHVEVEGLAPDRWYWYRFQAGDATSPAGRTRTAPAPGTTPARLRLAFSSCQQYEQGYYAAYRHAAQEDIDLFLHLGDYVYESSWGTPHVRRHGAPEPYTLDDYRARFALYKTDPDLQAAHARCPWLVTWDDHEVENDYAGERSENDDEPGWFLARRATAYQAYYEHLPLRRAMIPFGPWLRIHTRLSWGGLADLHLLDDRQYRSPQPCPKPGRAGSAMIENCAARLDPAATLLGARQERWLEAGLAASQARWNVLGQQTLMAQADARRGPGEMYYSDGWDGYPAARRRLLAWLGERKPANPVVIGGDVHSYWVCDLKPDFDDPRSPVVASEFVSTSISSLPPPEDRIRIALEEEPHIRYATGERRGYVRFEITPRRLTADLRAIGDARDRTTGIETLKTFVVEDGRPGPQPA